MQATLPLGFTPGAHPGWLWLDEAGRCCVEWPPGDPPGRPVGARLAVSAGEWPVFMATQSRGELAIDPIARPWASAPEVWAGRYGEYAAVPAAGSVCAAALRAVPAPLRATGLARCYGDERGVPLEVSVMDTARGLRVVASAGLLSADPGLSPADVGRAAGRVLATVRVAPGALEALRDAGLRADGVELMTVPAAPPRPGRHAGP